MNKAIITSSFQYLFGWAPLVNLILLTICIPCSLMNTDLVRMFSWSILSPFITAYMLLFPQLVSGLSVSKGENLSLLFTRPVTRFSYVMNKWLYGSFLVILVSFIQYLIITLNFVVQGTTEQMVFPTYYLLNLVLNSFISAALVICMASFPFRVGLILFAVLFAFSTLFGLIVSPVTDTVLANASSPPALKSIALSVHCFISTLQTVISPSIDLFEVSTSVQMRWTAIIAWLSNLTIYLSIATFVFCRREFFYATE